jgi:hypothetical protein
MFITGGVKNQCKLIKNQCKQSKVIYCDVFCPGSLGTESLTHTPPAEGRTAEKARKETGAGVVGQDLNLGQHGKVVCSLKESCCTAGLFDMEGVTSKKSG